MKQKIKAILDDDRGVSPVIGVILMVAITVILAAVIGTFVLGLGDSLEQAPQAQIGVDEGDANGEVDISHNGGDSLQQGNVEVRVDGAVQSVSFTDDTFDVGESITLSGLTEGNEVTVSIVHTPSESIIVERTVTV